MHFSDESKLLLIGSDGKTYLRRKLYEELPPKCLKARVNFGGGSVIVWGMISRDCVGPLVRLQGKVKAGVDKQLVKNHVFSVQRNSTKQLSLLMQDDSLCHKAIVVMKFPKRENVTVMDWPPQSPNLNPIENVRKTLGKRSKTRNPKITEYLWNALQEEWNRITRQDINKIISSCSR